MISLIVGLGNPGDEYKKTRHNAGFLLLDSIALNLGLPFSYESKFKSAVATGVIGSKKIHLLKPQTFMNKSGSAVSAYANYYNISAEEILVGHDELDLEPGTVRLKKAGGHGGHNGLRDIISCLSAKDFYRLRLGIGHPGDRNKVSNYVLKAASQSDRVLMDISVADAVSEIPAMSRGEFQEVMKRLHTQ
ncbi:MAG: aminoacyl-tRNA hydrolase [Cycloclasticus sp.]